MTTADLVNGSFELLGSLLIWMNIAALYRAKQFKGVTIAPTAFFFAWGLWNLFYYPHLGQWLSFSGGCSIVVANGIWVGQMMYYAQSDEWREQIRKGAKHEKVRHDGAEQVEDGKYRSTCSCGFVGQWRANSRDSYDDFLAHD